VERFLSALHSNLHVYTVFESFTPKIYPCLARTVLSISYHLQICPHLITTGSISSREHGGYPIYPCLGLVLPNGVLVYTPAGYSRSRRGLVTPLEIWSKAFQISSGSQIWSVLSDWAGSALCGAESSRTTVRLEKVLCNAGRTLTGIPRALPNIMEQYGRTHTGEQRVIQKGRWLC
jgi:hypothetical protein